MIILTIPIWFHVKALPALEAAAAVTGIDKRTIAGRRKGVEPSYARHLAMYLAHYDGDLNKSEIGRLFGRDHSSVVMGVRRIELEMRTRPETAADVEKCRALLSAGVPA